MNNKKSIKNNHTKDMPTGDNAPETIKMMALNCLEIRL